MMFPLQPCTLEYAEEAPFTFENSFVTPAPPETVFDLVVDGDREGEWFPDFKRVTWQTQAPHGVGSTRLYELTYMRLLEHFIAWDRGRRAAFWVSECSLPLTERFLEDYRIEEAEDGGARLTWRVHYTPNRWIRFLHPLLRPFFARDFRKAAAGLEALCAKVVIEQAETL